MSDEIVREFLVEGNENLDALDRELIQLEKDPRNRATLASVFRTIHTIKGTCGFLGFTKLEAVAHVGENLLSRLRDGELVLNPEITTALLQMVDAVRQMLQSIEAIGNEGERNDDELMKMLTRVTQGESLAAAPASAVTETPRAAPPAASSAVPPPSASKTAKAVPPASHSRPDKKKTQAQRDSPQQQIPAAEEAVAAHTSATIAPMATTIATNDAADTKFVSAEIEKASPAQENDPPPAQASSRGGVGEGSIRVDVVLLDKLMNLVGELVLARNQVLQFSNAAEDPAIVAPSQRLNLITTELQESVMKTRMQPIGNIWSKFPRTVRDVATSCGKQVRIEMDGKETELDKTIIEAIKDPLTHLVRNAVDHGIERPKRAWRPANVPKGRLTAACVSPGRAGKY